MKLNSLLARLIETRYAALPHVRKKKKIDAYGIANKYIRVVQREMIRGLLAASTEQIANDTFPMSLDRMRDRMQETYIHPVTKKKMYWFDFLNSTNIMFEEVKKGNSHEEMNTIVKTDLDLDILLAGKDKEEVFKAIYNDVTEDQNIECVEIDIKSLTAYIEKTTAYTDREKEENKKANLKGHLRYAKTIKAIAEHVYSQTGEYLLPQVVKESHFGRKYYSKINLQSAPRVVREAALGDCFKFDISTSVFAWKYNMVKFLTNNAPGLTYTLELLDSKNRIRKHLANVMFNKSSDFEIAIAKQVLTAVGFGARASVTAFYPSGFRPGTYTATALGEIVKSPDARSKLLNDPWFKKFIEEQQYMNDLLFNEKKDSPALLAKEELLTKTGKLSKNKVLAYMYQKSERMIIDALAETAKDSKVLLVVHDGFYTRTKPDVQALREELRSFMPIASDIEYEGLNGWKNIDMYDEHMHREHILREERMAAEAKGKQYVKPVKTKTPRVTVDEHFTAYDDGYLDTNNPYSASFDWERYRELCEEMSDFEFNSMRSEFNFAYAQKSEIDFGVSVL